MIETWAKTYLKCNLIFYFSGIPIGLNGGGGVQDLYCSQHCLHFSGYVWQALAEKNVPGNSIVPMQQQPKKSTTSVP